MKFPTKLIIFLLVSIITIPAFSNEIVEIRFSPGNEPLITKSQKNDSLFFIHFTNETLNTIFQRYTVKYCGKAFPAAAKFSHPKAAGLLRVYRFILKENTIGLLKDLDPLLGKDIQEKYKCLPPKLFFIPNDFNNDRLVDLNTCTETFANGPMHNLKLAEAPKAWDITRGSPDVVIGISDYAFNFNHPDLINQFLGTNPFPAVGNLIHGNQVSGVAAAEGDNNIGIAGMCMNCKLRAYFILDDNYGQYASMLDAALLGVKVYNCSWGDGLCYTQSGQDAVDIVTSYGMTVVAAAGNGDATLCTPPTGDPAEDYNYPASFDHVISVSGVGSYYPLSVPMPDQCATGVFPYFGRISHQDVHLMKDHAFAPAYTMQHNDRVDVVAPAHQIMTTEGNVPNPTGYGHLSSGTSFAAPLVAGVAGLMYSVYSNIKPDEVEAIIKCTADDIYHIPQNQPYIGKLGTGRVNAFKAVSKVVSLKANNPVNIISYYLGKFGNRIYLSKDIAVPNHTSVCGLVASGLPGTTVIYHQIIDPDPDYTGQYKWKFNFNTSYTIGGNTATCLLSDLDEPGMPKNSFLDAGRYNPDFCNANASLQYRETYSRVASQIRCDMTYRSAGSAFENQTNTIGNNSAITLFPNPAENYLIVDCKNNSIKSYEIINMQGMQVQQVNRQLKSGNLIYINDLKSGMYFIKFNTSENKQVVLKFIKL